MKTGETSAVWWKTSWNLFASIQRGCLTLERLQTGRLQRGGVEKYFQVDVGSTGSVKLTAASICLADTNTHTRMKRNTWTHGAREALGGRRGASWSITCVLFLTAWHRDRKGKKERREGEPENGRQTKERQISTFYSGKISVYDVWWDCVFTASPECVCVSARVVLRIVAATRQPLCSSEHMVSDTSLSSAILSVYTA